MPLYYAACRAKKLHVRRHASMPLDCFCSMIMSENGVKGISIDWALKQTAQVPTTHTTR